MQLAFNHEVVDRLIAAYSPRDQQAVATMAAQLSQALHASQARPDLYNIPLDNPLTPGVALIEMVHPANIAVALLSAVNDAGHVGLHLPVPELWVWSGDWIQLRDVQVQLRSVIPPLNTAEQPAIIAPDPAAELTSPAAVGGASAHAGADVTAQPAAAASAPQASSSGHLPAGDVTGTVTSLKGRAMKSPFDREYRARDRLGAMPVWWPGMTTALGNLFAEEPARVVPIENSPSPVMEYALAVDVASRLLGSAPDNVTVGELRAYLRTVVGLIEGSASGPVAFDLANHLASHRSAALAKREASGKSDGEE